MGKGNFFKKDIKKRKKEKKERGIKQKILEQKKKVEEKIHHVVEAVTEVKKSPEPEPVEEKVEVKPEPVEEKVQYLMCDQSIISYIMLENRQVIKGIQEFSENEQKILTFDAVINDFIENEKLVYNRVLTFDQVVNKLKQIGNFQYYGFDEDSTIGQRANVLFDAEKYIDDSDILEEKKLSKTDCVLIELLIDKSVVLVTNNTLLKKATTQEARERNVTVKIFDPLEL